MNFQEMNLFNCEIEIVGNKKLLNIENLTLSYKGRMAFSNVNFSIEEKKITAIVGPSGCGKSSFLMCLNRMIDYYPGVKVSGKISYGTQNLLSEKIELKSIRRKIGMIFQKPNPFPLSIRNNIIRTLKEHRIGTREEQEFIMKNSLEEVGLWNEVKDRLDTAALSLSGGQQQRLCIARALVLQPEVILFDEPCSALDPISSNTVEVLIQSLRKKYTVVIVTHNLSQARRIADFIGVFWIKNNVGQLIEFGRSEKILNTPTDPITKSYFNGLQG